MEAARRVCERKAQAFATTTKKRVFFVASEIVLLFFVFFGFGFFILF